jgi:hypothetical protein
LLFGLVENIDERYDVGVFFEGLEERDLPESTGGDSLLLPLELDVLDGHQFIVLVDCLEDFSESALPDDAKFRESISFFHF